MDIHLDSSVVEHLTSDAGVPGSIPSPAMYFHLYFIEHVHYLSIPTTFGAMAFLGQAFFM